MAISGSWYNETHTIYRYDFDGKWTWAEFHSAYAIGDREIDAQPHPVYVLLDMNDSQGVPEGTMGELQAITTNSSGNWVLAVLMGDDNEAELMLETFQRIRRKAGARFQIVNTEAEALAAIEAHRAANA